LEPQFISIQWSDVSEEYKESLFPQVGTLFLGVLLFAQGAGKFGDWGGYLSALSAFDVFPESAIYDAATVWGISELLAGSLLVGGIVGTSPESRIRRMGALSAMAVACAYLLITTQAYMRGLSITNCACFGTFFSQPLSPFVLIQDGFVLVWAGWEIFKARGRI
jgi:hypothetical protein